MDYILEKFAEWIAKSVGSLLNLATAMFAQILAPDMTQINAMFPDLENLFQGLQVVGGVLVIVILLFQLLRIMMGNLSDNGESIIKLVVRSMFFLFLIYYAGDLMNTVIGLASEPYKYVSTQGVTTPAVPDFTKVSSGATDMGDVIKNAATSTMDALPFKPGIIVNIVIMFMIGWNYLKLLIEVIERYLLLGVMFYTSPLALATGGSESTSNIFKSWCRMLGSQLILMILNIWFLRVINTGLANAIAVSATGVETTVVGGQMMILLGIAGMLRIAQRMDTYLAALGVNTAQTGQGLTADLMATAMTMKSTIGGAIGGATSVMYGGSGGLTKRIGNAMTGNGLDKTAAGNALFKGSSVSNGAETVHTMMANKRLAQNNPNKADKDAAFEAFSGSKKLAVKEQSSKAFMDAVAPGFGKRNTIPSAMDPQKAALGTAVKGDVADRLDPKGILAGSAVFKGDLPGSAKPQGALSNELVDKAMIPGKENQQGVLHIDSIDKSNKLGDGKGMLSQEAIDKTNLPGDPNAKGMLSQEAIDKTNLPGDPNAKGMLSQEAIDKTNLPGDPNAKGMLSQEAVSKTSLPGDPNAKGMLSSGSIDNQSLNSESGNYLRNRELDNHSRYAQDGHSNGSSSASITSQSGGEGRSISASPLGKQFALSSAVHADSIGSSGSDRYAISNLHTTGNGGVIGQMDVDGKMTNFAITREKPHGGFAQQTTLADGSTGYVQYDNKQAVLSMADYGKGSYDIGSEPKSFTSYHGDDAKQIMSNMEGLDSSRYNSVSFANDGQMLLNRADGGGVDQVMPLGAVYGDHENVSTFVGKNDGLMYGVQPYSGSAFNYVNDDMLSESNNGLFTNDSALVQTLNHNYNFDQPIDKASVHYDEDNMLDYITVVDKDGGMARLHDPALVETDKEYGGFKVVAKKDDAEIDVQDVYVQDADQGGSFRGTGIKALKKLFFGDEE